MLEKAHMRGVSSDPLSAAIFERDADIMDLVRTGLLTNNVALHFQPVVQAHDITQPAFFEGLIRVLDPTGRVIPACEFIETIEDRIEGRQIDCLALDQALKALRGNPSLRLSVNMSPLTIGYDMWDQVLERGLYNNPTAAERLIIEITETSHWGDPGRVADFMVRMDALGCSFALDDFGAGSTAFRYFKDFFFDIVKIDGSFVRSVHKDKDSQVLIDALVRISNHFEMFTVAEFVESPEDAVYLIENGIDCLQGYLFGAAAASPRMPDTTRMPKTA
jgi:EAL domain-containing protein (putative c-di-GMP-specific phosphodiesterase class I)